MDLVNSFNLHLSWTLVKPETLTRNYMNHCLPPICECFFERASALISCLHFISVSFLPLVSWLQPARNGSLFPSQNRSSSEDSSRDQLFRVMGPLFPFLSPRTPNVQPSLLNRSCFIIHRSCWGTFLVSWSRSPNTPFCPIAQTGYQQFFFIRLAERLLLQWLAPSKIVTPMSPKSRLSHPDPKLSVSKVSSTSPTGRPTSPSRPLLPARTPTTMETVFPPIRTGLPVAHSQPLPIPISTTRQTPVPLPQTKMANSPLLPALLVPLPPSAPQSIPSSVF